MEGAVCDLVRRRRATFGRRPLAYTGGVALNAVANGRLLAEGIVDDLYLEPAAGDNGIALGCAFYGWLAVLGGTLGHGDAAALADELVATEESRVAERGGLPGWRSSPRSVPERSWCWGAAGYAASRTSGVFEGHPGRSNAHLRAAVDVIGVAERDRVHLCCGEAGQLVVLDAVASCLGDERARLAADRLAGALAADALSGERWSFFESCSFDAPSLFWGRAGVLWALCRITRPDVVPNLLVVE